MVVICVPALLCVAPSPAFAGCSETGKFTQPGSASYSYYGGMAVAWPQNNAVDTCSSGAVATTMHMLFRTDGDFMELGMRERPEYGGYYGLFTEYRIYPSTNANLTIFDSATTWPDDGSHPIGLGVRRESSTSYRWYYMYSVGSSETGWTTIGSRPTFPSNEQKGIPQGEISGYGAGTRWAYESQMKFLSTSFGWNNFASVGCAAGWLMTDASGWDVQLLNPNAWDTLHQPTSGGC